MNGSVSAQEKPASAKQAVVLHLIESFDQGGSEQQALQLAGMLKRDPDYEVKVATIKAGGALKEIAGSLAFRETRSFPLSSFYDWNFTVQVRRLAGYLRASQVKIIHTHDFYTNILGMLAARLAAVPVRIASRRDMGDLRSPAQNWVERRAYGLARCVVANCDAVRTELVSQGIPNHKIVRIYNSVDLARFKGDSAFCREEVLRTLGLPPDADLKFVTMVANFRLAAKDHGTFLQAARMVRQEVPNVVFVLAGEGELQTDMKTLAQKLGIESGVRFIGSCPQMPALLFISDVCVLSSKSEGFPNVILEYMASGRPVVATDVGGVREAVVDGETGHLVGPGDGAAMAARILSLLRDPRKAAAMGKQGRERAQAHFSPQIQLAAVRELYAGLVTRART
jgi:glycosyltransferase involved in cell wall biosynthesis